MIRRSRLEEVPRSETLVFVRVKQVRSGASLPDYKSQDAAGFDFHLVEDVELAPNARVLVPTGISMELPRDSYLKIVSRSGLAWKRGVVVFNAPGIVDSDYRGEIQIILTNKSEEPVLLRAGDRVAQGVVCPLLRCKVVPVDNLTETTRGEGGFGSTGE